MTRTAQRATRADNAKVVPARAAHGSDLPHICWSGARRPRGVWCAHGVGAVLDSTVLRAEPRAFGKLVSALRRESADPVRKGRPRGLFRWRTGCCSWRLDWRTNLTMRHSLRSSASRSPRQTAEELPDWTQAHNTSDKQARARVEHVFAHMKTWQILRDCRLKAMASTMPCPESPACTISTSSDRREADLATTTYTASQPKIVYGTGLRAKSKTSPDVRRGQRERWA